MTRPPGPDGPPGSSSPGRGASAGYVAPGIRPGDRGGCFLLPVPERLPYRRGAGPEGGAVAAAFIREGKVWLRKVAYDDLLCYLCPPKMKPAALKRLYACTLLLMLLSAHVGQAVHIFREDPLHFRAFCGDLLPDNGARTGVVELCIIDDFYFFPFLGMESLAHIFYSEIMGILQPEATRCKRSAGVPGISLRAPPASGVCRA